MWQPKSAHSAEQMQDIAYTLACNYICQCACLQAISDALSAVLSTCGRRNLRIVLDAVTTATETVGRGHVQQQAAAIQQLMVPLGQRWQQPGLLEQVRGLLECMSVLVSSCSCGNHRDPSFVLYAADSVSEYKHMFAQSSKASGNCLITVNLVYLLTYAGQCFYHGGPHQLSSEPWPCL